MEELFKKEKEKYSKSIQQALSTNKNFIETKHNKSPIEHIPFTKRIRAVIPYTKRYPSYEYYNYHTYNLRTKDETTLRFVPYLNNKKTVSGINLYDTVQQELPATNFKQEIYKRMIRSVLEGFDDAKLFRLCNMVKTKVEIDEEEKKKFDAILKVSKYTNTDFDKVMLMWEEIFDRSPKQLEKNENALFEHFCGVCFLFDCQIHIIPKCIIRKQ